MRTYILRIELSSVEKVSSHHLRAFMVKNFSDRKLAELSGSTGEMYINYPRIQYKVIDEKPFILAIDEGIEALKEIKDELTEMYLGHKTYKVLSYKEEESEYEVGVTKRLRKYEFITPWLALSEMDYSEFKYMYAAERDGLLSKMVIRNILAFSRALDIEIPTKIKAKLELNEIQPYKLGTTVSGFIGKFDVNFQLPNYLGLGNIAERGFGTIRSI